MYGLRVFLQRHIFHVMSLVLHNRFSFLFSLYIRLIICFSFLRPVFSNPNSISYGKLHTKTTNHPNPDAPQRTSTSCIYAPTFLYTSSSQPAHLLKTIQHPSPPYSRTSSTQFYPDCTYERQHRQPGVSDQDQPESITVRRAWALCWRRPADEPCFEEGK
jgi:hypothetical protein